MKFRRGLAVQEELRVFMRRRLGAMSERTFLRTD